MKSFLRDFTKLQLVISSKIKAMKTETKKLISIPLHLENSIGVSLKSKRKKNKNIKECSLTTRCGSAPKSIKRN
jgi:hypothetical protein